MKTFTYRVGDTIGLHARPAGELVSYSKRFSSDIKVKKGSKEADAKRLIAVMGLGAKYGDELTFSISGEDEDNAARELENFCNNAFGRYKE